MASVTLQGLWISLVSDPTQVVHLQFASQVNPQDQTPGEDRMYGNGRYSALTAGATQKRYSIAADPVSAADAATLRAWSGLLVCFRDDWGEKFFGSYRSPQVTRHSYNTDAAVALTVTELTYSDLA